MDATALEAVPAADHPAPRHSGQVCAHFALDADVEPSVLPRTLQAFALRNLTPHALACRQQQGRLRIDLTVVGLDRREIDHLTMRLNQMVPVHTARSWISDG